MAAQPALPRTQIGKGIRYTCAYFYKYEGVSPVGSHKPNTAVAQAISYNKEEGVKRTL